MNKLGTVFTKIAMKREKGKGCTAAVFHGLDVKGKVKCTLVQALRLCTGRTAHRGSRRIALLFLDHGIRGGKGSA